MEKERKQRRLSSGKRQKQKEGVIDPWQRLLLPGGG